MICGLPGSGKSTLATKLEKELPALLFTPDEWIHRMNEEGHNKGKRKLVEELKSKVAFKALSLGLNVVLENGFWSQEERQRYRDQAKAVGAETQLHYLEVSVQELKRRLTERNKNLSSGTCFVNPDFIDSWIKQFEPPTPEELKL